MQDRPTMDELLEAVANFLTDDVMKATTGRVNFHARVAANGLQMVRRELADEEARLWREFESLAVLFDDSMERPESLAELRVELGDGNAELVRRIADGDADAGAFRVATLKHLREMTHDKLLVTNPDWLRGG